MPPPAIQMKSLPRGNSFAGSALGSTTNGGDLAASQTVADPPAPPLSTRPADGGDAHVSSDPQWFPPHSAAKGTETSPQQHRLTSSPPQPPPTALPSTHTNTQPPAALPSASSDVHAPGSGVFVKRKVKKSSSSNAETPLPSERRNRSPTRVSDGGSTPRVKSILRNPTARHSTVTFSADLVGITLQLVDSVTVIKKTDVEQATLRDEVYASLAGPVMSKEQIMVNITADDDGIGLRIEGIIDHLRNSEEQAYVIRRLADFLHSPNVFGKSLAPFLTLSSSVGAADQSINYATQRILVREARINDVPIRSVAPSSGRGGTPRSGKGPVTPSVTTPQWDPDYTTPTVPPPPASLMSAAIERFEHRRRAYQASLGILYASPLSIPTPHHGRWDRAALADSYPTSVRPDPPEQQPAERTSSTGAAASNRGYTFVPHGVVDSPTSTPTMHRAAFPAAHSLDRSDSPAVQALGANYHQSSHAGRHTASSLSEGPGRILYREPPSLVFSSSAGSTPSKTSNVYRTRQYVKDEPARVRGALGGA